MMSVRAAAAFTALSLASFSVGWLVVGWTLDARSTHDAGHSDDVNNWGNGFGETPIRQSAADVCRADCAAAEGAAVHDEHVRLMATHFGGSVAAWPESVRDTETPVVAEARIAEWARRCLKADAWLVIHCDVYPCAFATTASDVVPDAACMERWSPFDLVRKTNDDALSIRFVVDSAAGPSEPWFSAGRITERTNLFLMDHVDELNRRHRGAVP